MVDFLKWWWDSQHKFVQNDIIALAIFVFSLVIATFVVVVDSLLLYCVILAIISGSFTLAGLLFVYGEWKEYRQQTEEKAND